MKKFLRHVFVFLLVCGPLFLGLMILKNHVRILISETDSLPQHYFLHWIKKKPRKGDLTVVHSPWLGKKIIKKIVGEGGEEIWRDPEGAVWVETVKIGLPLKHSPSGRILTPIRRQVIPEGFVFLASSHPESFDSRYEELGLVPESSLQGRAVGVM